MQPRPMNRWIQSTASAFVLMTSFTFGAGPDGYIRPQGYIALWTPNPLRIDGKLDEAAWGGAPWTAGFVDIEGDPQPRPRFRTRAKMLWDKQYFYIAAEMEEPHLQATFTKHDSFIFQQDNDFEVFIDPDGDGHNYAEFEINALNTGWDLRLPKPYKNGGNADHGWEIPGLLTAVHLNGTLNTPNDTDLGWTLEMAFPWEVLGALSDRPAPPAPNDQWRVNFSRVEWRFDIVEGRYRKRPGLREDNWVWSPQGTINMHRPETWGYVQFASEAAGSTEASRGTFRPDHTGPIRYLLFKVHYAQVEYRQAHKRFATSLGDLGLADLTHEHLSKPLAMSVDGNRYTVTASLTLPGGATQALQINEEARVTGATWSQAPPGDR